MNDVPLVALDEVRFARRGGFRLGARALSLAAGETLAVVGASGCGKTTLIHLMAGILTPDAGSVSVGGMDLASLSDHGRRALRVSTIGMVFQRFALLPHLSGLENVLLPYHVSSALHLDDAARARARRLAGELGVEHTLERKPERLSQGERQRLAIARALVTEPRLLLADEPTGNLDPARSRETVALLVSQARERGTGLVVATHDHAQLEHFDRVLEVDEYGELQAPEVLATQEQAPVERSPEGAGPGSQPLGRSAP